MRIHQVLITLLLLLISTSSYAAIDNVGLIDNVLARYAAAAASWATVITERATWLFWTLVVISMVWTFGFMALRRAELGEFFAEFIRFTIFTGFFWWLLINGPSFANSIILSMRQMGGSATGTGHALSPSSIIDIGFEILDSVIRETSLWSPVDSAIGIIIALIILVILALVAINMLLLLISGWILAYSGIFYLGFGGSRWTSDIAINYFKTVLGIAMQLLTMVLLVGIGESILSQYYANMSGGVEFGEMAVLLIVAIILLVLVNKLPQLIAGVITGASVGGVGIGSFGAGAALGAAGALGAAATVGAAMTAASAAQASGGAKAIMSAISQAQENVASGTDVLSSMGGKSSSGAGSGTSGSGSSETPFASSSETPFASAAGFSSDDSTTIESASSAASSGESIGDISADTSPTNSASRGTQSSPAGLSENSSDSVSAGSGSSQNVAESTSNSGASDASAPPTEGTSRKGLGSMLATAGRITADASANLARGTKDVAKQKASDTKNAVKNRVSETIGGQISSAIDKHHRTPEFESNSLSGNSEQAADAESEVAAFRDKDEDSSNQPKNS